MPDNFTGLGTNRNHRRRVEVVPLAEGGIPRPGVARAPIREIQLRIIRTRDPGAGAAGFVRVARLPGLMSLFAGACGGVTPPQLFAGVRVPAIEKAANAVLRARDSGDEHAIGDLRRHGLRIAFFPLGRFLPPDLLAGFLIQRDHVRIERGAEHLAFVKRHAFVRHAAAHDAARLRHPLHRRAPDLFAGQCVNRIRPFGVADVHHTVVDHRLRLLAEIVVQTRRPHRREFLDVAFVDLTQRAVTVLVITHAVGQHVIGAGFITHQFSIRRTDAGFAGFGYRPHVFGGATCEKCQR